MKINNKLSRYFTLMLLIIMISCVKSEDFDFSKIKKIDWNPNLAIPLASSSFTIMDLLKLTSDSSKVVADDQGFVSLVYKYRLFKINPASMFPIPATSFNFSHTITALEATIINSIGTISIPLQQDIQLTPADSIRIDSLIYGKGKIMLTISGIANNNSSIAFNIPEATKNGVKLNATFALATSGVQTIDLSGYKFDLTKVAGQHNTFRINAILTISNLPAGSISEGQEISLDLAQITESIKVLSGYLGRFKMVEEEKSQELNFFNYDFVHSQFSLVNPYLKFTFTHSLGIPVDFRFTELRSYNTQTKESVSLLGNPGIPNPIKLVSLAYASNTPVVSTYTVSNITTNGALVNFFNIKPNNIIYNFSTLANPDGFITQNFLRDTSSISLDVEAVLPLYGYLKNFIVQDTFDFKIDKLDEVENLLIRSFIDNEFPFDANIQVYLTDENYIRLDSLASNNNPLMVPAAQVNPSTGDLISANHNISDFSFSKLRINKIAGVKKVVVHARINTSGTSTQNVKIYDTYKLKFKLAAQIEIKKKI